MRVRGTVDLEGIILKVDLEAPDTEREVWVTNVHHNVLVIPRERWKVEFLGLPEEILRELKEKGVQNLEDVLEYHSWNVREKLLSPGASEALKATIARFREIALLANEPEPPPRAAAPARGVPLRVPAAPASAARPERTHGGNGKQRYRLDTPISDLPLPASLIAALEVRRGAKTVADLAALGNRIAMTPGIKPGDIAVIHEAIRDAGASEAPLPATPALPGAATVSDHLTSQGLRPGKQT